MRSRAVLQPGVAEGWQGDAPPPCLGTEDAGLHCKFRPVEVVRRQPQSPSPLICSATDWLSWIWARLAGESA